MNDEEEYYSNNYIKYDNNNNYSSYNYDYNTDLLVEIDRLHARVADLEEAFESLTRTVRSLVLREKVEEKVEEKV